MRCWGKVRQRYGKQLIEIAQEIAIQRGYDFKNVLEWDLEHVKQFIESKAWKEANKRLESQMNAYNSLADSIIKTIAQSGTAIVKTIASK